MVEAAVDVISQAPRSDAERLLRTFLARAYRRPVAEADVQRFLSLFAERHGAGLGFAEAMVATYTAIMASPGFVFLDEKPGRLDDFALATRLALFLWNSPPDDALRLRAERGELQHPDTSPRRDRAPALGPQVGTLSRCLPRLLDRPEENRGLHAVDDALQRLLPRRRAGRSRGGRNPLWCSRR
jgi:hypothetical protein